MLPPVNDNEDLILKEENPEIYVHLENVLVHMIDAQDIAIFKSQKDYVRNKQKLSEYICRVSSYRMAQKYRIIGHFFPKYRTNIGHFFPKYRTKEDKYDQKSDKCGS